MRQYRSRWQYLFEFVLNATLSHSLLHDQRNSQDKQTNETWQYGLKSSLQAHIKAFRFQPNNLIRAIFKQAHTYTGIDKKNSDCCYVNFISRIKDAKMLRWLQWWLSISFIMMMTQNREWSSWWFDATIIMDNDDDDDVRRSHHHDHHGLWWWWRCQEESSSWSSWFMMMMTMSGRWVGGKADAGGNQQ